MKTRLTQLALALGVGALGLLSLASARNSLSNSELDAIRGRDHFSQTTNAACELAILEAGEVTLEGCPSAGDDTPCVKCRRTNDGLNLSSFGLLPGTTGNVGYRKKGGVVPCNMYDRSDGVCQGGVCGSYMPAGDCDTGGPDKNPPSMELQPSST